MTDEMTEKVRPTIPNSKFAALKERHRAVRDDMPEAVALRIHRAISWLGRAEAEVDDADVRFILLWIGFNSAYAADVNKEVTNERGAFQSFFETLVSLDSRQQIYFAVWRRFPHEIRLLLDNRFVFAPFWKFQNGSGECADWEDRLAASQRRMKLAINRKETAVILSMLFDRLYVLRNQLVHGGATWNSSVNRAQVRDGSALLHHLLPVFTEIMMEHPNRNWGRPFYPVIR